MLQIKANTSQEALTGTKNMYQKKIDGALFSPVNKDQASSRPMHGFTTVQGIWKYRKKKD